MTASRWWVKLTARWLARIDGVKGQIQMFSLAVTAFSTFSIMLQGFGLGHIVPYIGAFAVVTGGIYTYYYTEGGVWNQVSRDRQDMSENFAGPTVKIDDTVIGTAVFAAIHKREPTQEEREAIQASVNKQWEEYRNGVELND